MKIEIEIPDLEEIYSEYYGDDGFMSLNGKDLKKMITDLAVERYVDKLYDSYFSHDCHNIIQNEIKNLTKEHEKEIIDKVISNVTETVLKKKTIVQEMPKKSEINTINKEWEKYFSEMVDKAIAKKFK